MLGVAPSILTAPAAAVQAVSSMYYYTVLEWYEYGLSGEDMTRWIKNFLFDLNCHYQRGII